MRSSKKAFTLIELLVTISIIMILLSILMPTLNNARMAARRLISADNLNFIGKAVNFYGMDHSERCPPTVAYMGQGNAKTGLSPTTLINVEFKGPRSVKQYLGTYIEDAKVMTCPSAPRDDDYIKSVWGQVLNKSHYLPNPDPTLGTYSFYWNYIGYLPIRKGYCRGITRLDRFRTALPLAGCTLGKTPNAYQWYDGDYISCERFKKGGSIGNYSNVSRMWNRMASYGISKDELKIRLNALYVDGSVQTFGSAETQAMKVLNGKLSDDYYVPVFR